MNKNNNILHYLSLLFNGWLGIISNVVSLASLVVGLWNNSELPVLLSSIPREGYITLSFFAFAIANYRVYKQIERNDSDFKFEILKSEGVGVTSDIVVFTPDQITFADEIKFQVALRIFIVNVGPQTAVKFSVESLPSFPSQSIKDLQLELHKIDSHGKVDNPYYFRTDDMSENFQLRIKFSVQTETLEKIFGSLGKVGKVQIKISAIPTGRRPIFKDFECDLSPAFSQVESRVANRAIQSVPLATKAINLMKRFWMGSDK